MNRRLANVKTRRESGLEYVISKLQLATPFGKSKVKEQKPFFPGQEAQLELELDRVQDLVRFVKEEEQVLKEIEYKVFHDIKDVGFSVARSKDNTLSVVELFEIKNLLLRIEILDKLWANTNGSLPEKFRPVSTKRLLDILDPREDRLATFYVYEEFSPKLTQWRGEKRQLEIQLRKLQKEKKEMLRREHSINLTPKFDCIISKTDLGEVKKFSEIQELEIVDQDYMSITFALATDQGTEDIIKKMNQLQIAIEEEEERVLTRLSREVWKDNEIIIENCHRIGELDFTIAKAKFAVERHCTRPRITEKYQIHIVEGRHLYVEELLHKKEKKYMPIDIDLDLGVTCITGANMGGKTVSLKLVGLMAIMTQYGYFVPCKMAKIGLSGYMQMLIGDSQSVERGLSSFGSEMEELKEILDNSKDRTLILIDEIASGTNPHEGLALTKSLIDYLKEKNYISLITTHFDVDEQDSKISNMQVLGLANADFDKLNKEIKYANRKMRIEIIGKYMDYRLRKIDKLIQVPKDALNIAKMLGIGDEIIDNAKKYLSK